MQKFYQDDIFSSYDEIICWDEVHRASSPQPMDFVWLFLIPQGIVFQINLGKQFISQDSLSCSLNLYVLFVPFRPFNSDDSELPQCVN